LALLPIDVQLVGLAVTSPSAVIMSSTGCLQFVHSMRKDFSGVYSSDRSYEMARLQCGHAMVFIMVLSFPARRRCSAAQKVCDLAKGTRVRPWRLACRCFP
jgi:hypothetical protein